VRRRNMLIAALAVPLATSVMVLSGPIAGAQPSTDYTVLIQDGASRADAVAAVEAAGGTVTGGNTDIGTLTVRGPLDGFVQQVSASPAVFGATHARPIGQVPQDKAATPQQLRDLENAIETEGSGNASSSAAPHNPGLGMDPLDVRLWGLRMINADLARQKQAGDHRVRVGVLDSGVDATHPDIAPNIDLSLSRNFTVDIPTDPTGAPFDGPCEFAGCVDPPGYDDNGHGTHVAGTIAAAVNGLGVSGVAPKVTLVSIRGGQDAGFLFLDPVVNALTYGADIGLDVINMSFYIDPWLFNCTNNPADTPEQQIEQRTTIAAVNRALDYAHGKGVTLVNSLGNNHMDLGNPPVDTSSPDYPAGMTHPRPIDNATCLSLPVEGNHVLGISALGPTTAKADYSNYGTEQITVSAPGGYFRDGLGTPAFRAIENEILSTLPHNVGLANHWIDAAGNVTPAGVTAGVLKDCNAGTCAYYRYLQGTSMAAPHASGVAALIVSEYGHPESHNTGGLTLAPDRVEQILTGTAAQHACPNPPLVDYTLVGRTPDFNALCVGSTEFNAFYGHGIVDALAAVTRGNSG
jgi:subtilisin family serine protease